MPGESRALLAAGKWIGNPKNCITANRRCRCSMIVLGKREDPGKLIWSESPLLQLNQKSIYHKTATKKEYSTKRSSLYYSFIIIRSIIGTITISIIKEKPRIRKKVVKKWSPNLDNKRYLLIVVNLIYIRIYYTNKYINRIQMNEIINWFQTKIWIQLTINITKGQINVSNYPSMLKESNNFFPTTSIKSNYLFLKIINHLSFCGMKWIIHLSSTYFSFSIGWKPEFPVISTHRK